MTTALAPLLAELPSPWRRDGLPVDALQLTADADVTVTVADGQLVLATEDATIFAVNLDTPTATLGVVVDLLNLTSGVTATLLAPSGAVLALCLVETAVEAAANAPVTLQGWTSPTWRVLTPVARELDAAAARLDLALSQANLLTSAADFARWWARWTGTLVRDGEDDATFTARQRTEVLRPRENNHALAALLETDFPELRRVVEVRDLRRWCFACSDTPLRNHPLRGARYNAAACEVVVEGFPSVAVLAAARRHVAGGVTVFLVGVFAQPLLPAAYDLRPSAILIGTPPAMQIGVGAIGIGKIGP